jgi:hypothetical protein
MFSMACEAYLVHDGMGWGINSRVKPVRVLRAGQWTNLEKWRTK